jgi:hypothetical protein
MNRSPKADAAKEIERKIFYFWTFLLFISFIPQGSQEKPGSRNRFARGDLRMDAG